MLSFYDDLMYHALTEIRRIGPIPMSNQIGKTSLCSQTMHWNVELEIAAEISKLILKGFIWWVVLSKVINIMESTIIDHQP